MNARAQRSTALIATLVIVVTTCSDGTKPTGSAALRSHSHGTAGREDDGGMANGMDDGSSSPVTAFEICDGKDDDQDGVVDEHCAKHGSVLWVKQADGGGSGIAGEGRGLAPLAGGGFLVTGSFSKSVMFDAGKPSAMTLTSPFSEASDVFLAKYRPDGEVVWVTRAGGPSSDEGLGVAALPDGSSFVVGTFSNWARFGDGESGETELANAEGSSSMFVAKYAPDGTLVWAKRADISGGLGLASLAAAPDGSAIVTGVTKDKATFAPGEKSEATLTPNGIQALLLFIAKYGPDGSLTWLRRISPLNGNSDGSGVAVGPDGSAFVTGGFNSKTGFQTDESRDMTLTTKGLDDVFLAKYDAKGSLLWVKSLGGPGYDVGYGVSAGAGGGAVVTGYQGIAPFADPISPSESGGPGVSATFLAKFDMDGALQWNNVTDTKYISRAWAVAALADGGGVTTGELSDRVTFDPGEPSAITLTSDHGNRDTFIAKYSSGGKLDWAEQFNASGNKVWAIATLQDRGVVLTGNVPFTGDFNAQTTIKIGGTTSALGPGFFVVKLAP